jgi:thymidylate synthase ThyX
MSTAELRQPEKIVLLNELEKYAPSYTPENFTIEEVRYLNPFFSNIDQPVFIVQHLPEEVIGALSAKYSRATESMRRTFLKEYVGPIIHPENQKDWADLKIEEKKDELEKKKKFEELIDFLNNNGGIDCVVNIQRGRKFFDKWLVDFGDDSISELGGIHLCIEGLSNIATKEIEDQRIGLSPIEKSSRYVSFADKLPDGGYRYVVPGEIKNTCHEEPYKIFMDALFSTYSELLDPYLDYIKDLYPKGDDEGDVPFEKSRKAKTFDDLRDLLPFSTITNLGLFGNGRSYEYLINRLAEHPLGELRYWGYKMAAEINKVTPSFIRRLDSPMGKEIQAYKRNVRSLRDRFSEEQFDTQKQNEKVIGARLLDYSKDGELDVLAAFLFGGKDSPSLDKVREKVSNMSKEERREMFLRIFSQRSPGNPNPKREEVRFKKLPRSFENSKYLYELWARGGDYRDLHRHRMLTQERQNFTTRWDFDLEGEVMKSPFNKKIETVLKSIAPLYETMVKDFPDVAQYTVPFGYIQHWYMNLTAREVYYMAELRTGPQGRPHYRKIVQEMAKEAIEVHPDLFNGMMVDWNDYSLARRESEKWTEKKRKDLKV